LPAEIVCDDCAEEKKSDEEIKQDSGTVSNPKATARYGPASCFKYETPLQGKSLAPS